MKLCLANGSDAYSLNNGTLCIKNKNGEYNFNNLSADFIIELIKKQPIEIEDLKTSGQFKYKVQAYIFSEWLVEQEIVVNMEGEPPTDITINEYNSKSIEDIVRKSVNHKIIINSKTIMIETYYKRNLKRSDIDSFIKHLGKQLAYELEEHYPFTEEREPKTLRLILTETRIDNKILAEALRANNHELCIPIISSDGDFEIGPFYTQTQNSKIQTINERTLIKTGPSHEIWDGIPFIAGNRFPITENSAKSLAKAIAYILDREFDERLGKEDFSKVWVLPYQKNKIETINTIKSLRRERIHILYSTIDKDIEITEGNINKLQAIKKKGIDNLDINMLKIPIMERLKIIKMQKLAANTDGGHRLLDTAKTRRFLIPFVNKITGIMDKIDLTSIDNDIFMYSASRVVGAATVNTQNNSETARSTGYPISAAGKGRTTTQSQVSCIAEAIERYSANFPVFKPIVIRATGEELGTSAIEPNEILNFSYNQYQSRDKINKNAQALIHRIPKQFEHSKPTNWSPVINIINPDSSKFIPTAMLGFNYTNNLQPGTAMSCSNGLASGNSKAEAMVQALYEIIERDACAIWWYNKLKLKNCEIPENIQTYTTMIKNKLHSMGRTFEVLELPTDFDVTVTSCISYTNEGKQICVGLGCHYDISVSISRAITEMYQMLVGIKRYESIKENTGIGNGGIDKLVCDWLKTETINNHSHLTSEKTSSSIKSVNNDRFEYIEEELEYILNQFDDKGFSVYGINMTSETIGFPVVKMFVPGMRHFWPRLGEGRIYQVPVKLGYLSEPNKEEKLNTMGFFF